jgi:methionine-R-sulfoxide reductase
MTYQQYRKPDQETLKATLDPLVFDVTQKEGTEPAGSSPLNSEKRSGLYVDVVSGEPLFLSGDKYDSGTGWPSFVRPVHDDAIVRHEDRRLFFQVRTEVRSAIADSHLGHVFTDGPRDRGGLRYCINGAALRFIPADELVAAGYGEYLGRV